MVQMRAFADRKPAQLSGGQQQRIALARALVFEPELVLMDEPLGALDKQLREHMQYEIKHIHENLGVTVVYVTHDQSEALTMSNRIAVFDDGVIQQLDAPVALYEKPENSFVAQFIGENNTLAGTVDSLTKGVAAVTLDSGDKVKALAVNTDGKGSRTSLSIRPERCIVSQKKSAGVSALKTQESGQLAVRKTEAVRRALLLAALLVTRSDIFLEALSRRALAAVIGKSSQRSNHVEGAV